MNDARPLINYGSAGEISVVQAYESTDRLGRKVAAAENIRHESRGRNAVNVMFSKNVTNILPVSSDVDELRSGMTYAQIGNRITCINENAFSGCSSLTYVAASHNLKKILNGAFENCESLSTFEPFNYSYTYPSESNAGKYLYTIGRRAFANTDLRDITINLHGGIYENPDYDPSFDKTSNPTPFGEIGVSAFAGCKNLKSVKMTYGTYLSKGMFQGCSSLTSVQLFNRHSFINPDVFRDCTALGQISYPQSFWAVPDRMFYGCTSLSSVVFNEPSDVKSIGRHAFYGCSSLTSLTLPSSISSLTKLNDEFLLCSNVQRLEFKGIPSERLFTGADEEQLDISTEKFYCDADREKLLKSLVVKNEKIHREKLSAVLKDRELNIDDFLTFTSHNNLKEIASTCI